MYKKGFKRPIFIFPLCTIFLLLGSLNDNGAANQEKKGAIRKKIKVHLPVSRSSKSIVLFDDFSQGKLDTHKWQITRAGDFKESIVDVYDIDPGKNSVDYRLRLRANTLSTNPETVKFHGVRSLERIDFSKGITICFDLDWNRQTNGCYLAAAIYLCPTITHSNPRGERDWLKFEYVGVPPGRNARSVIAVKNNNHIKYLDLDGWPQKRQGRYISHQKISIKINKGLDILENGKRLFSTAHHGLAFTSGYLYLLMSSHSNYPAREVYFDNIVVFCQPHPH